MLGLCSEQHIISSCSSDKITACPQCREELTRPLRKHRYAEREVEELATLREELAALKEELAAAAAWRGNADIIGTLLPTWQQC